MSPSESPALMETALEPSMKRGFAIFVETHLLDRRFDEGIPFFSRAVELGIFFVCYFPCNSVVEQAASAVLTIQTMMISLDAR